MAGLSDPGRALRVPPGRAPISPRVRSVHSPMRPRAALRPLGWTAAFVEMYMLLKVKPGSVRVLEENHSRSMKCASC